LGSSPKSWCGARLAPWLALCVLSVVALGCKERATPAGTPEVARPSGSEKTLARARPDEPATNLGPVVMRVDGKPVATVGRLPRGVAAPGDEIEVTVELAIAPLWEIYPLDATAGGAAATRLDLTLPKGVVTVGPWATPKTVRSTMPDGHAAHVGRAVFTRMIAVGASSPAGAATISCRVSFQACDDRRCLKPEAIELALPLTIVDR